MDAGLRTNRIRNKRDKRGRGRLQSVAHIEFNSLHFANESRPVLASVCDTSVFVRVDRSAMHESAGLLFLSVVIWFLRSCSFKSKSSMFLQPINQLATVKSGWQFKVSSRPHTQDVRLEGIDRRCRQIARELGTHVK